MPTTLPNSALRLSDLPAEDSSLATLSAFGHSFDGYQEMGSLEACAKLANARVCNNLSEARACLFFELRRWRHFGEAPDAEAVAYMRSLVERIREFLRAAPLA